MTIKELIASEEPYVPPPEFYTRLAADTLVILFELGPHSRQERRELIETLRWAEKRRSATGTSSEAVSGLSEAERA